MDERSEADEYDGEDGGEGGLVQYNPIGEYYGGRNDKNERHGRGRAVLPNGDLYLGCYFRGKRYGLGVYRYKNGNGARYGGDWVNGTKQGWGTMYFPDGSQYTGNWHRGVIHGWGVYVYSNGDEYEGWWYMGVKNGRGIYRTKSNNEKFVGSWLLGLRHGKGMLIRAEHRFIGNWYNDVPRGPGVYVFPELGVEQHGRYTIVKLQPPAVEKYKEGGQQVVMMRAGLPPMNPLEVEKNTRMTMAMGAFSLRPEGDPGEGAELPVTSPVNPDDKTAAADQKNLEDEVEIKVNQKLKEFINIELESQEANPIPVSPVWRVMQVTKLITKYPDETVPPPPIPETPMPEVEISGEEDLDQDSFKRSSKDEDEEIRQAKILARTHQLGEIYTGSGVCQLPLAKIRWPDDIILPRTFSKITVSTIEEFKSVVESIAPQLEPLDIQAIIAENLHVFKGHGISISDKWKECLGNETECAENVDIKGAPGDEKRRSSNRRSGGSNRHSDAAEELLGEEEEGADEAGIDAIGEVEGGVSEGEEEEESAYTNQQPTTTEGETEEEEFDEDY
ncbi:Radial spoke head 1 [Orchesella cincta]|uniref:Radial spoke head 1 n=1 Tax=Orchesella cincta TaxID=48709 RepID=A0A1D2MGH3_ORCCI|nr:Radial spoke head 1 [Orchesella cincta]